MVIVGMVFLVLLAATALWGVLTYGLGRSFPFLISAGGSPEARGAWRAAIVLAIALLLGHMSGTYLARQRVLSVGWWAAMAATGVGFWVGERLPWPAGWRWEGVNIVGALLLSFVLATGAGRICARWRRREEE
jgi:hypothetical protein